MQTKVSAPNSALDEAKDWLRQTLALGPLAASDLYGWAESDGISKKTPRASKEHQRRHFAKWATSFAMRLSVVHLLPNPSMEGRRCRHQESAAEFSSSCRSPETQLLAA